MNTIEDRLRAATNAAADTVAPGSAPPLKLPEDPGGFGWRRGAPRRPAGWPGWLAPAAAAAAVVAVVAASLVISGTFHGHQRATTSVTPALAGVPPYYVALRFSRPGPAGDTPKTWAAVVNTATGAVLATVAPPKPYVTFAGVSGAGDDRTFVVAAQRNLNQPVTRFFRLRINPAGRPGDRARLSPLPVPENKNGVLSFALSPGGTSLAVADFAAVRILNVSTGAQRTWHPSLGGSFLGGATTDALLSWSANGRKLAFAYNSDSNVMGAYLLDTTAPGSNLLASSRRLVHAPKPGTSATPWWQVRLTPDGRTVIAVLAARNHRDPHGAAQKLEEFSARTGRLLRVLNYLPVANGSDIEQVLWNSPSGHTLLVANTKPYPGKQRAFFLLGHASLLTGQHFTPLPWVTDTLAAAW